MTSTGLPTIGAREVARWYPYAVVRTFDDGVRYVDSVHETRGEAMGRRDRMEGVLGHGFEVYEVVAEAPS